MRRHLHNSVRSSSVSNPIEPLEPRRLLNAGDLDTTFGTNGGTISAFGQMDNAAFFAVAIQSDGKIIAAGAIDPDTGIDENSKVLVARFKTNGTLDPTFSGDGFEITKINGFCNGATSVAIQSDDKILIGGDGFDTSNANASKHFHFGFVARLKSDGTTDTTFGTSGVAETKNLQSSVMKLAGNGSTYLIGGPTPTVAHFTSAGKPDMGFGINGITTLNSPNVETTVNDIAVQADGKPVVIGGTAPSGEGAIPPQTFMARLTNTGKLDKTFSGNGALSFDSAQSVGLKIAIDGNGNIYAFSGNDGANVLTRITTTGNLDPTFGSTGQVSVADFIDRGNSQLADEVEAIAIQGDGKVVLAGISSGNSVGVLRINTDGSADTTFSVDGRTINGIAEEALGVAINPTTQQIIVVGDSDFFSEAAIAAFHSTGGENSPVAHSDQDELGVTGTAGKDSITIAVSGTHLTIDLNGTITSFTAKTVRTIQVHGLDDNDRITVSASRSTNVFGDGGNDTITGNTSLDTLSGGGGNDRIISGGGESVISGGSGNDRLYGGVSNDTLSGGAGKDTLYGGDGKDNLSGGGGNDFLSGDAGSDILSAGAGNDRIYARDNTADTIYGGSGTDSAQVDNKDQYSSIQILIP